MSPVQHHAFVVVGRACGFAGLGIMTMMVGLSYDPLLCARSGAILASMMYVVLRYRAMRAYRIDPRRSEVWMLLDAAERPPGELAPRLIRDAYRRALLRYAGFTLAAASGLWAVAVALRLWA